MSGKRKTRSESSNKSSSSPDEKRSCGTLENETDEDDNGLEAVKMAEKAVKMAEDLKSRVEEVLTKLKQLDIIETRLTEVSSRLSNIEETVTRIDNDMSDLKDKHSELEKKVTDLEESVKFNEEDISELRIDTKKNEVEIEEVRKQVLYLETYSRRENIKFVGIAEEIKNTQDADRLSQQTENNKEVIYQFMEEHLKIEGARDRIEFQRIHRLGKPVAGKSRPIIARLLRYTDKELIMDQARKNLKGKHFSIFDDIPKELYEARKKQLKKFKEARDKGKSVYFSKAHPDKLFIDGKYVPPNEPLN